MVKRGGHSWLLIKIVSVLKPENERATKVRGNAENGETACFLVWHGHALALAVLRRRSSLARRSRLFASREGEGRAPQTWSGVLDVVVGAESSQWR